MTPATALTITTGTFLASQQPGLSASERAGLASSFHFTRLELTDPAAAQAVRTERPVNPSLRSLAGWISSVGAGVALADIDGDGLPNDACLVDPRTDRVTVLPVPGRTAAYRPYLLDAPEGSYRPETVAPMGCLPADFNEDGRLDVLVYYWGRPPVAFLRATDALDASGYRPIELGLPGERWYTNAATTADLDGDGHADLVIGNYFRDGARILDAIAAVPDEMQHSMSRAANGGTNRLLRWANASDGPEPSVTFEDWSAVLAADVAHGWTLAIGAADLDEDLLPELYFANDFGPDRLLHNESVPGSLHFELLTGERSLTTPGSKVLGRDSFKGMGVDFGDLNGDGFLDIYVSNIAGEYALEESHFLWLSTGQPERMADGVAPYVDASEAYGVARSGWAWDARIADFNNDGVPELLQATGFLAGTTNRWPELHELAMGNDQLLDNPSSWPAFKDGADLSGHEANPFFVRSASGRYVDVAEDIGLADTDVSRGLAIADVDGDGDQDLAVANQWGRSYLYRNDARATPFLGLRVLRSATPGGAVRAEPGTESVACCPPAVGARVSVALPDGRRVQGFADGGNGHSGKRSADIHLGLGGTQGARSFIVTVRWRDASGLHTADITLTSGWHTLVLGA